MRQPLLVNPPIPNRHRRASRTLLTGLIVVGLAVTGCKDGHEGGGHPPAPQVTVELTTTPHQEPGMLLGNGEVMGGALWWHPGVDGVLLVEHITDSGVDLGTLRYSTEPAFNAWSDGQVPFSDALASPVFADHLALLRHWHAHGKRVLINVFTPVWLADMQRFEALPQDACPTTPVFAPPTDLDLYEAAIREVVAFLSDQVGTGLSYEIWNEPDCFWIGTTEELLDLYAAAARAIRAVDPTARVGGLSMGGGQVQLAVVTLDPNAGDRPTLERWIEYCAATPLDGNETRLPIDFVSYHNFGLSPRDRLHLLQAETIRQWLVQYGYPEDVPLYNTEWNYDVFDYLDGHNGNTSQVGAAHAAATVMRYHRIGLSSHNVQALVDVGEVGSKAVVSHISAAGGVPRAGYRALEMLDKLRGTEVTTQVDHPWVHATAFLDEAPQTLRAVVAVYTPTAAQSATVIIHDLLAEDQSLADLVKQAPAAEQQALADYAQGDASELTAYWLGVLSPDQINGIERAKERYQAEMDGRADWGIGPDEQDALDPIGGSYVDIPIRLDLGALPAPSSARVARLDAEHVVDQARVEALQATLKERALAAGCEAAWQTLPAGTTCPELEEVCRGGSLSIAADMSCAGATGLAYEFSMNRNMWRTRQELEDAAAPAQLIEALTQAYQVALQTYRVDYEAMWQDPQVSLAYENCDIVNDDSGAFIELSAQPYSVLLVELQL